MNDSAPSRSERGPSGRAGDGMPPGGGRRVAAVVLARAVGVTTLLVAAYYLLPLEGRRTGAATALFAIGLLGVAVLLVWQARAIAHSPHPRLRAVEALGTTLALYLVLFAVAYYVLERSSPGSFSEPLSRTDALYFTLTTFTTVGYGDITAVSPPGRVVTMLQMLGGLLLVGVAARILAAAVQAGLRRQGRPPPPE
ncbi:ion channel [Streptomyces ficellus]|uniref:Two pore domain potassium channel family protein n=1 Tax=Streptomyces ficellus TaxID=1977088 RepID=A0A6I6FAP5_9ACTN|nr:ion channel [Streptomyces ficellus]QGV77252.1 two pore domain potassium channel family protein [Streptomyces ficellus]